MSELLDPGEPPPADEAREYLNAKNLKNLPLILHPVLEGTEPGTKPNDRGVIEPWNFVECDVWVLGADGTIEEHDRNVRFSWKRCLPDLREKIGKIVGCKPVQEADNSVIFTPLSAKARAVAEQLMPQIKEQAAALDAARAAEKLGGTGVAPAHVDGQDLSEFDSEPF